MSALLLGVVAGVAGGTGHLLTLAWRTRALVRGRAAAAAWTAPLGLLWPLLACGVGLALGGAGLVGVLIGLIAARLALTGRLARRLEEGPWT